MCSVNENLQSTVPSVILYSTVQSTTRPPGQPAPQEVDSPNIGGLGAWNHSLNCKLYIVLYSVYTRYKAAHQQYRVYIVQHLCSNVKYKIQQKPGKVMCTMYSSSISVNIMLIVQQFTTTTVYNNTNSTSLQYSLQCTVASVYSRVCSVQQQQNCTVEFTVYNSNNSVQTSLQCTAATVPDMAVTDPRTIGDGLDSWTLE